MRKVDALTMHIFSGRYCLTLLICCLAFACGANSNQASAVIQPVDVQLSKKVEAKVAVGYHDDDGEYYPVTDRALTNLFDLNPKTWWVSNDKVCGVTVFDLNLDRHTYINKITIINHGDIFPLSASVSTRDSSAENAPMISASTNSISLNQGRVQTLRMESGYYLRTLAAREIILSTEGCNKKKGKLEIEEIQFEFSDRSIFKPEMAFAELKAKLKSTAVWRTNYGWHFVDDENEPIKEKYLAHLMYYGLNGDAESERLFRGYSPSGADLSEDHSGLEAWYDHTKATNR